MRPSLIIDVLRERGIRLTVKDGHLSVKAREGQLQACEWELVRTNKAAIIAILQVARSADTAKDENLAL